MNVGYSFQWSLTSASVAQVRAIIEQVRLDAIELGAEVEDLIELNGDEAHAVQIDARHVIMFSATIPDASKGKYGLAGEEIHSGPINWSWSGSVIVSSMKAIGTFHGIVAGLGIEVVECFSGMIFNSKPNAQGAVEVEQLPAFDWTDF